mmetsp:Transcript_3051/g.5393  ORF Transcript_3051/g.5393 Transcript_3051/m.5393 type:complete len:376 (-) Transcript_3051:132-1259(-)|eukprot:CAMPEP_0182447006 /NCGR_PEP_ID=MMETSP1172-20130603/10238_1 /TAXON_ID=708627 /ORGANISM="Timspurckia oligopyrenoides, Strain CCMP3278" /LENGTH=375 /DNA_ID=CAMNT_0024643247 /DNA_START=47 /DNA_END=1174 /DNA_ORIENTATION=+
MAADGQLLEDIVGSLPRSEFAFAYGSGAITQSLSSSNHGLAQLLPSNSSCTSLQTSPSDSISAPKVVDFIVAVNDPEEWHRQNLEIDSNRTHYSAFMRTLGPHAIAKLQDAQFGARMYFNTLIPWRRSHRMFKYGVISVKSLEYDLMHWTWMYAAGRLQKPVRMIVRNQKLEELNQINIQNATRAALVTLPEQFEEEDMFVALASLSYTGDVRMEFQAEDAMKAKKIVCGNLDGFRRLYEPAFRSLDNIFSRQSRSSSKFNQAFDVESRTLLLSGLPRAFLMRIQNSICSKNGLRLSDDYQSRSEIARWIAMHGPQSCRSAILSSVKGIVRHSSLQQSLKGTLTAGFSRSVRYACAKLIAGRSSVGKLVARSLIV